MVQIPRQSLICLMICSNHQKPSPRVQRKSPDHYALTPHNFFASSGIPDTLFPTRHDHHLMKQAFRLPVRPWSLRFSNSNDIPKEVQATSSLFCLGWIYPSLNFVLFQLLRKYSGLWSFLEAQDVPTQASIQAYTRNPPI
jgi:hypothetical protein